MAVDTSDGISGDGDGDSDGDGDDVGVIHDGDWAQRGDPGFVEVAGNGSGCSGGGRSEAAGKGGVDNVVLLVWGMAVMPLEVEVPILGVKVLIVMMEIWARRSN